MAAGAVRERLPDWIEQMRRIATRQAATGACTVATAMELWAWTFDRLQRMAKDAGDTDARRYAVPLSEALGFLLSARAFVFDVVNADDASLVDICHAHVVRACSECARICAEAVFGSLRHPAWDTDAQVCYRAQEIELLEEYVPGLASTARAYSDVIEADGSHRDKAGPCMRLDGFEEFLQLRAKLDGCLAGGYIAKLRAADGLMREPAIGK